VGKGSRNRAARKLVTQRAAERERLASKATDGDHARFREQAMDRGCLVCRESDGGFQSREHIVPESLGNTDHIWPPGIVCDRCNHGVLSRVDSALMGFLPIDLMRTFAGVPSKGGALPATTFDNGVVRAVGPNELSLELDSERFWKDQAAPPGRRAFSVSAQRGDTTPRRLRDVHRCLAKMVLEYAWVDRGEAAFGAVYDHVRDLILGGPYPGYLTIAGNAVPDDQLRFQYIQRERVTDGAPLFGVLAEFWGVPIITDTCFVEPPNQIPGWLLLTF
jgi:hypothetical protein